MAHEGYVGRTEARQDSVWPKLASALAATLDLPDPGEVLPPLWHWMLFQEWAPASGLGPDGHPKRGGFMPPLYDLPRRMWAGGRVRFPGALRAGDAVTGTRRIAAIRETSGASGRLVFVTVQHEIVGPAGIAVTEEQDIVYRGLEGAAVRPAAPVPAEPGAFVRTLRPDPVLLFRYSALTGNGHRIHYDLDYATREECYPGLVVHGPLQATLLALHALAAAPGTRLSAISYRGRRPAFHGRDLHLLAWRSGDSMRLETRDDTGAVCMEGEATLG